MRKTIFLTLILVLGLGLVTTGAWADTFFPDETLVQEYHPGDPPGAWMDVVGPSNEFDIVSATLSLQSNGYHLSILTNWQPGFDSQTIKTGDLFLATDNLAKNWNVAIVLDTNDPNRAAGTVYYNPTITTSIQLFGSGGIYYGGQYDEADPNDVPVMGTSDETGSALVQWYLGYSGSLNMVDILLSDINGFDPLSFQFLAASATCANDVIVGTVPIPGTLLLLGSGLLGMAGLGWRKVWKQG